MRGERNCFLHSSKFQIKRYYTINFIKTLQLSKAVMESASPGICNAIIPKNWCSEVKFAGITNIFLSNRRKLPPAPKFPRKHGGYACSETIKAMSETSGLYSHRSTPRCSARSIRKTLFSKWRLFNLVSLTVQKHCSRMSIL